MADTPDNGGTGGTGDVTDFPPKPNADLLSQVANELKKGKNDAAKTKLKEKLKSKEEHLKAIALIDREIKQILEDHAAGLL